MDAIVPAWPDATDRVGALSTVRSGGFSVGPYDDGLGGGGLNLATHVGDSPETVAHNRALLKGTMPARPVWLRQVHGNVVVDAAAVQSQTVDADASFTTRPGIACTIMTADCMAVLLRDRHGTVVAAAHAGWRGLASGVLENTVQAMRHAGAGELMAWLGPAIGPRHFEVGDDVRQAFTPLGTAALKAFTPVAGSHGKYLADLTLLARLALTQAGVMNIIGGHDCTVSEPQRFYSFRRDRVTGRMASCVWLA